jgi:hypothetical protein
MMKRLAGIAAGRRRFATVGVLITGKAVAGG